MKLTDLDGTLLRWSEKEEMGTFQQADGSRVERLHMASYFTPVPTLGEAHAVSFLCPKAFAANGGKVGTHTVLVAFEGSPVPAHLCCGTGGTPTRWKATGTTVEDLSLTPSIQEIDDGHCSWHGFVTNGEAA